MKICIKCNRNKNIDDFSVIKSTGKRKNTCMECVREYQRVYWSINKEPLKEKTKNYRQEYLKQNKTEIKEQRRGYLSINKNHVRETNRKYQKERRRKDPAFRLKGRISNSVLRAINGSKSGKSVMKYLPYSFQDLKVHLEKQFEPWMNWSNWGTYNLKTWKDSDQSTWTWQIDHIIPQSLLVYTSMEDENFRKCWALTNLRPLSSKTNIEEGNKR